MEEVEPAVVDVCVAADYMNKDGCFYSEAYKVLGIFVADLAKGIISSSSVATVYCINRRFFPDEEARRKAMAELLMQVTVVDAGNEICNAALSSRLKEYGDALVEMAGIKAGAEHPITRDRDEETLKGISGIRIITPVEFVKLFPDAPDEYS